MQIREQISRQIRVIKAAWDFFWFNPVPLYTVSLFRVLVGFGAFFFYLPRQFALQEFFFEDGMLPLSLAKEIYEGKFFAFYFAFPTDPAAIQLMHGVFLLALFGLGLGLFSRYWALVAFILHTLFLQRNFTVLWGADKVMSFWLLYLVLADSDRQFSLRAYLFPNQPAVSKDLLTPVVYRLIPIQLCIIYAYSGLEKLHGITWWYGNALWSIFTNGKMMPFDTSFVAHFPVLLVIGCYMTLLFEIYFPMAVWVKPLRKPWLIFGLLFHTGIGILLDLTSFSYMMCIGYLFFANRDWLEGILKRRLGFLR